MVRSLLLLFAEISMSKGSTNLVVA